MNGNGFLNPYTFLRNALTRRHARIDMMQPREVIDPPTVAGLESEDESINTNNSFFEESEGHPARELTLSEYENLIEQEERRRPARDVGRADDRVNYTRAFTQEGDYIHPNSRNPAVIYFSDMNRNDALRYDILPDRGLTEDGLIPVPDRFLIEGVEGRHIYPVEVNRNIPPARIATNISENIPIQNELPVATNIPIYPTVYGAIIPHSAEREENYTDPLRQPVYIPRRITEEDIERNRLDIQRNAEREEGRRRAQQEREQRIQQGVYETNERYREERDRILR